MDMYRITARWTGFTGAPGYSNFYFNSGFLDGGVLGEEAELLANRVRSAFLDTQMHLAPGIQIQVLNEVPIIDSDTGVVQDYVTFDPVDPMTTSSGDTYAGPAGAVVTWRTNDLRNGRRIRGRTFLVPMASTAFQSDGTLVGDAISDLQDFADTLMGGSLDGDLGVWSRPQGGSGGVFATVTGYTVPDMVAVLRSRRD